MEHLVLQNTLIVYFLCFLIKLYIVKVNISNIF